MSSEARPGEVRQPDWYLHDGDVEVGPLIEVELRKALVSASKSELQRMRVRQGASDWHPAARVLVRFKELSQNGVFLKLDEVVHGPFTPERAAHLLRTDSQFEGRIDDTLAKVGRHEQWTLASLFLNSLDRLLQAKASDGTLSGQTQTPLAKAILIEEPLSPVESESAEPKPVAFFKASLVVEDSPAAAPPQPRPIPAPVPRPVSVPEPVSQTRPGPETAGPETAAAKSAANTSPQDTFEYRRPIIQPTSAKKSQSGGPSPWMLWSALAIVSVLLIGGGLYFFFGSGGEESLAEGTRVSERDRGEAVEPQVPLGVDNRAARPPVITIGMLFRPEFLTAEGPVSAGSAFAARLPGSERPIVISALHLFGPSGGMAGQIQASSLSNVWTSLSITDCVTQRDLGQRSGRVLLMADAKPYPQPSDVGDVVAYLPDSTDGLKPLKLSEETPRQGDRVWLVSELVSGPGLVHGATIEGLDKGYLVYRFDDPSLQIIATSGAPVVNAKHEVIAVNAAGGPIEGAMYGIGTPTYKFFEPLANAAGLR